MGAKAQIRRQSEPGVYSWQRNGRITNARPAQQSSNQQHYDHSCRGATVRKSAIW